MLQTVQRNRSLAFHRLFVVGMALGIFVTHIFTAGGCQLFASGKFAEVAMRVKRKGHS